MFSFFDMVSSFHQIVSHKDTVSLTAFCTPTGFYERLVMPQCNSASLGWFEKVINEMIQDLKQVAAYVDDEIVFDSTPVAHVSNIRSLFESLRKSNFKLPPSKAQLGATDKNVLGHSPNRQALKHGKSVDIEQYADGYRCQAGAPTHGWHKLLPRMFARLIGDSLSGYRALPERIFLTPPV